MGFKSGVLRFNAVLLAVFILSGIFAAIDTPAAAGRLLANEESIPESSLPGQRVNLASGKSYTRSETPPRKDKWDDSDTTPKLTDGIKVRDNTGSENIAGFVTHSLEVVVDLGEVYKVSGFMADALGNEEWSISNPRHYAVEFQYSRDGENFTSAGIIYGDSLSPVYGSAESWIVYEFKADYECDARYVKVVYTIPDDKYGHLWISEIEIYKSDTPEQSQPESSENSGTAPTGDTGIIGIAILSLITLGVAALIKRK